MDMPFAVRLLYPIGSDLGLIKLDGTLEIEAKWFYLWPNSGERRDWTQCT